MEKYSNKTIIEKFTDVHGIKYNYSLVDYKNSRIKVTIICPKHGEFKQLPKHHYNGSGCPTCSGSKKLTTKEFIERATNKHGDKYDYSLVDYKNREKKVSIKCSEHGIFKQRPADHLNGHGCRKCLSYNLNDFISLSNKVHDNKYDYSLVDIESNERKVNIICPEHGEFNQTPSSHIKRKHGCPKCSHSYQHTTEEVVKKFVKNHGNKYDYSLVRYIDRTVKVKIICPEHGLFEQLPNNHNSGTGCPVCNESHGERKIRLLLEERGIEYIPQHKFIKCRNKLPLPFDFYLPEHNMCIEYNGRQHYEPVDYFGGDIKFELQQKNDNIKKRFCVDNGIRLIVVKYDEDIVASLGRI